MIFSYYSKLSRKQKAIYKKSDEIDKIKLNNVENITSLVIDLENALEDENRVIIEKRSRKITAAIIVVIGDRGQIRMALT